MIKKPKTTICMGQCRQNFFQRLFGPQFFVYDTHTKHTVFFGSEVEAITQAYDMRHLYLDAGRDVSMKILEDDETDPLDNRASVV